MIGAGLLGAVAGGIPGAPGWRTIDSWTNVDRSQPWNGYTHRVRINKSFLGGMSSTSIRLTYQSASNGSYGGASTTKVYVGVAASTGDSYDFESTPVEVLFAGASGFSIALGASITSDEVALALDGTKDILIAGQTALGGTSSFSGYNGRSGYQAWYKYALDAATVDAAGYTVNAIEAVGVVKIEVK